MLSLLGQRSWAALVLLPLYGLLTFIFSDDRRGGADIVT
jgi:hypothetical protein